ncbi:hypothetical protein [Kribbella deserti]|uniref:PknH-like extracellular domain-containing protein n=1 Tax=Kribbella deserti TaxID=1926257 RepID=A0ABV6QNP3_9ACTN
MPPAVVQRTTAELTKALLALADMPSGFSIEPDDNSEDDVTLSSKDPRCAALVRYANADMPPGSKASANRSFSGGEQGPFIDESLDAMGSAKAVAVLQRSFQSAIKACTKLTITVPGEGRAPIVVREVSAPKVGTNPVAVRFTAGGALEGFEVTMVTTGVKDVVVSLSMVAGLPEDIDGALEAAVGKAEETLTTKTAG